MAWDSLLSQATLSSVLKDEGLVKQYMIETESIGEFVPKEIADLWLCSCGTVNHKSEEHCVSCKKTLSTLLASFDVSILTAKKGERLEEQCAAEKLAAEEHLHKKIEEKKEAKKLAMVVLVTVACIIALSLVTEVFIPHSKYTKAVDLLNNSNFSESRTLFSELGDYKDSADMVNECW